MWPFKTSRAVTETVDVVPMFSRWLRAQRPPFEWFAGLSVDAQTHLAELGDEYLLYANELVAGAPDGTEGEVADQTLARQAAERLAASILAGRRQPGSVAAHGPASGDVATTAGLGRRRAERDQRRQTARDAAGTTVFGRPPDKAADPDPVDVRPRVPTASELDAREPESTAG